MFSGSENDQPCSLLKISTKVKNEAVIIHSPPEDSSKQRRVEALGRGQPPLHFGDGHLVFRGRAEEGEAPRHRAEDVALEHAQVMRHLVVMGRCVAVVGMLGVNSTGL